MTDLDNFVRRQQYVSVPSGQMGIHTGKISRVDEDGNVFAILPWMDNRVEWGPLMVSDGFLPLVGADCLIGITAEPGPNWLIQPTGAAGGGGGGDLSYVHTQGSPSAVWTVVHGLGKYPSVTVVDTGDSVVIPDVEYIDANTLQLAFGSPTSGKAYVN